MKKLMILLILLVIPISALGETVKMSWRQASADLPSLQEWQVFAGQSSNTATQTKIATVPYTNQSPPFTVTSPVTVTGTPGTRVKYYFSIAAVSRNGISTARVPGKTAAGVDYLEFLIPYGDVSQPFEVIFEIVVSQAESVLKGMPK